MDRTLALSPRRGFTLVELLVVVAVIVILLALLLPAIGMARANARAKQCASNQGQVFSAWTCANSRDKAHPVRGAQWTDRLTTYLEGGTAVFFCPDDTTRTLPSSYGFNAHAWRFGAQDNSRIALLDYKKTDAKIVGQSLGQLNNDWPADYAARHFQKVNVAFFDGHVESYEPDKIDPRRCDYFERYWRPAADSNIPMTDCTNSTDYVAPPAGTTTTTTTTTGVSTTGGTTTTTTTTTGGTTTGSLPPPTLCDVKTTYGITTPLVNYNGVKWLRGNFVAGWYGDPPYYIITSDGYLRAWNGCGACNASSSPSDWGSKVWFVGTAVYNDPNLLLNSCGSTTPPPYPFPPPANGLKVTFYSYGSACPTGWNGAEPYLNNFTPTAVGYIEGLDPPYNTRGFYCPPSVQNTNCGDSTIPACAPGFLAVITGKIQIPASGSWTFSVSSDDAAIVYVNGSEAVNSFVTVGLCSPTTAPQSGAAGTGWSLPFNFLTGPNITLSAGQYDLLILLRNHIGAYQIQLKWTGPGTPYATVPSSALVPN